MNTATGRVDRDALRDPDGAGALVTGIALRELGPCDAEVLDAVFAVENRAAKALLREVFPGSRSTWCGSALSIVLPVPAPPAAAAA